MRVESRLEAEDFDALAVHLAEPGREPYFVERWGHGARRPLPDFPALLVVLRGREDTAQVRVEALQDEVLVDAQVGTLRFDDPRRRELTVVLGRRPSCGNALVEPGETCDCGRGAAVAPGCDGPNDDRAPDACRTDCQPPRCGDGVVDSGESCDDANDEDRDSCTTACRPNRCGDGLPLPGAICLADPLEVGDAYARAPLLLDLDADGHLDLLAIGGNGSAAISARRNLGQRRFEPLPGPPVLEPSVVALAAGAVVVPGRSDVVVAYDRMEGTQFQESGLAVFSFAWDGSLGWTAGPFLTPAGRVRAVAVGHLSGSAQEEIVVATSEPFRIAAFAVDGGTLRELAEFAYSASTWINAFTLAPMDGGARADVIIATAQSERLTLLRPQGDGLRALQIDTGLEEVTTLGAVDLDGDGRKEIAALDDKRGLLRVLHNLGGDSFAVDPEVHEVGDGTGALQTGDVDGDGLVDLVQSAGIGLSISVLLGDGQGGLHEARDSPIVLPTGWGYVSHFDLALGDLDGDGAPDLVMTRSLAWGPEIMWNDL